MANPTRCVKVFGIVMAVAILLLLILMLVVGGKHGPARHVPFGTTVGPALVPDTLPGEQ